MPAAIRTARVSDIDALATIENAVFEADRISRKSFRHLVGVDTALVLVAESSGEIAGYCVVLLRSGSSAARLYSIATDVNSGGAGHGRALLDAAERAARDSGRRLLRLEVREGNDRARFLYERNGYRRIGEVSGYYADGTTAFRYEKQLSQDSLAEGSKSAAMGLRRA
jgi:ribosomal protein S18 acetylase RimI-like enzyme